MSSMTPKWNKNCRTMHFVRYLPILFVWLISNRSFVVLEPCVWPEWDMTVLDAAPSPFELETPALSASPAIATVPCPMPDWCLCAFHRAGQARTVAITHFEGLIVKFVKCAKITLTIGVLSQMFDTLNSMTWWRHLLIRLCCHCGAKMWSITHHTVNTWKWCFWCNTGFAWLSEILEED